MPGKDLHEKPFDEGTIAKLEIFEAYAQEWIPTWVMQRAEQIHIFDFFAGSGYDKEGIPGSPVRILQKILDFKGNIYARGTKVHLHLNEFDPKRKNQPKFEEMKASCEDFVKTNKGLNGFLQVHYYNKDTADLFLELVPLMKVYPSLVYLDQNGVKFLSQEYINVLDSLDQVDFLYFVSSSYFKRFGKLKEFKGSLSFSDEELDALTQKEVHRAVLKKIKSMLPEDSELMLFPFSIKKGANIYGIVFGAKHIRAVDKFLTLVWKANEINGEANFDIDEEHGHQQNMFEDIKLSKKEAFAEELMSELLSGKIYTNKQAYHFTLSKGHIAAHAREVISSLKGQIVYQGKSPLISYDSVYKKNRLVHYQIIRK